MEKPDWKGFPIRLGRAIDQWPGGGQKAFAAALTNYAQERGFRIPTSYRTLVNYLGGKYRPTTAWVDAAAAILGTSRDSLLYRERVEPAKDTGQGVRIDISATPEATQRTRALVSLILNKYFELPMPARWIIFHFVAYRYASITEGWDDVTSHGNKRAAEVREVVRQYFGPLLYYGSRSEPEIMALACSLASAAYLQLSHTQTQTGSE